MSIEEMNIEDLKQLVLKQENRIKELEKELSESKDYSSKYYSAKAKYAALKDGIIRTLEGIGYAD